MRGIGYAKLVLHNNNNVDGTLKRDLNGFPVPDPNLALSPVHQETGYILAYTD